MRQEMSKVGEKGPKKVDKQEYKDMSKAHALQHAEKIAYGGVDEEYEEQHEVAQAWRKGGGPATTSAVVKGPEPAPSI
jgi:general stress protein YciG